MENHDPWMSQDINEQLNHSNTSLEGGTNHNQFEDNFRPDSNHNCKLPDSEEYLASLENKLARIKRGKGNAKTEGKELLKSLEENNDSCMYRLIASDSYSLTDRDLALDTPTKLSKLSSKWVNPEQALTVGELVELVKADYLEQESAETEDTGLEKK